MSPRGYKYGAVPLEPIPEEGINTLRKGKALWNRLVDIHYEHRLIFEQARRVADEEYNELKNAEQVLNEKIDGAYGAYADKRTARMKAGTRDADDPLIKAANQKINELKNERSELWKSLKPARKRADKRIDKEALNDAFKRDVNAALRGKQSDIPSDMSGAIYKDFMKARSKTFKGEGQLKPHDFDDTGRWFYRFREKGKNAGVSFSYLLTGDKTEENDRRAFVLTEKKRTKKRTVYKLRAKLAGGATNDSKVYGHFDLILHRPIPDNAQIQNANLVRRRTGDKFSHTVSFTLRLPDDIQPREVEDEVIIEDEVEDEVIGMDLGFREFTDGKMRIAALATNKESTEHFIELPKAEKRNYLNRMEHIETIRGEMDKSATELGKRLLPLLKTAKPLPEDHPRFIFVKKLKNIKSNVTLDYERAYKMARWFMAVPQDAAHFGPKISNMVHHWWEANSRKYREMHNLRRKALADRKESYRIESAAIVARGLPIAVEKLNLSFMAEKKDKDNKLSSKALSNRFKVSPSEFRDALKNAAEREGIKFLEVPAAYTSKKCNACDKINKKLRSEAEWVCAECGCVHDRDINAAINIAKRGYEKLKKEQEAAQKPKET